MCTPIRIGCQRKWKDVLGKIFSLYLKRDRDIFRLSRIVSDLEVVEVAGVEPASCGVFMQASTSLVGSYKFSPEVLASDLLTPEHRLRFH